MSVLLRLMHCAAIDSLRLCISPPEQLEFWDLTENGGSQWKVEDMPGDCGHDFCIDGVSKYFVTSFEWVLSTVCVVFDLIHFSFYGKVHQKGKILSLSNTPVPMDVHVRYRSPQNICGAPHQVRVAAFNWRRGLNNQKKFKNKEKCFHTAHPVQSRLWNSPRSVDDPPFFKKKQTLHSNCSAAPSEVGAQVRPCIVI